jgi:hypothetical protein
MSRARAGRCRAILPALSFVGAIVSLPALAERHPLHKALEKFEAKGTDYSAETDPRTGDVVIRYQDGSRRHRVIWVWPNKLAVTVAAAVSEVPDGALRYSYRLLSSPSSRQGASDFSVAFGGPIINVASPKPWWALPFSYVSVLSWSETHGKTPGLPAGATLGGFRFDAATRPSTRRLVGDRDHPGPGFVRTPGSLPGIVSCYVSGFSRLPNWPSEPPENLNLPDMLSEGLTGSTIGPLEIPEDDTVNKMLVAMDRDAKEGLELGWIEKKETSEGYRATLSAVRRALFKVPDGDPSPGDRNDAMSWLRDLAAQVQADSRAGAITSEEFALLAYNIRYLLERLGAGAAR